LIKCKRFRQNAKLPVSSHPGSALAYDLFACLELDVVTQEYPQIVIQPGEMKPIPTGIGVEALPMAIGFIVKDRSSMAKKRVLTSGGVIDADYRGEIIVFLENRGDTPFHVTDGLKIAQMVPIPTLTKLPVVEFDELSGSERGDAGFGSTGK
jgi:dUTP pyrophosphatase